MNLERTAWTIFCPVGTWQEPRPAAAAAFAVPAVQQYGFQFTIQRKNRSPKIFTDQRLGNALSADAGFPAVVQQEAVAVNIVAALMYQPLNNAKLLVVQMRYCVFQLFFLSQILGEKRVVRLTQTTLRHKVIQF